MAAPFTAKTKLPPETEVYNPYSLFSLFIPPEMFATISLNTNRYAETKGAGPKSACPWHTTTTGEIKVFVGILVYMGVHNSHGIKNYWKTDLPGHNLGRFMGLNRLYQIKRYFHVSDPDPDFYDPAIEDDEDLREDQIWWHKVNPLAARFRTTCKQYWDPSSTLSIDEAMIRCFGRSVHTYKMPNKLIKQGYKLYSICDSGYTLYWVWASRAKSLVQVKKLQDLTKTGSMVLRLVTEALPPKKKHIQHLS